MNHKLSVLVQIDLHGSDVRLVVTGCVTAANQHALHPLVARARTLIPPVAVTVDLTGAEYVEAGAVDQLRWALGQVDATAGAGPVTVLTPVELPAHQRVHRPVTTLAGHRSRARVSELLPRSA